MFHSLERAWQDEEGRKNLKKFLSTRSFGRFAKTIHRLDICCKNQLDPFTVPFMQKEIQNQNRNKKTFPLLNVIQISSADSRW
ncbi:hypothetical protein CEXT_225821 [Caerostris extrusa]|uniref:Uncharacterized protein n=1 Tax=Caerostris extrusa TaxID=172846 RepID=A0AAV4RJF4_CAEEX|nr:hypothetical protein CEXT_225821 [Caerostris extrusa]